METCRYRQRRNVRFRRICSRHALDRGQSGGKWPTLKIARSSHSTIKTFQHACLKYFLKLYTFIIISFIVGNRILILKDRKIEYFMDSKTPFFRNIVIIYRQTKYYLFRLILFTCMNVNAFSLYFESFFDFL